MMQKGNSTLVYKVSFKKALKKYIRLLVGLKMLPLQEMVLGVKGSRTPTQFRVQFRGFGYICHGVYTTPFLLLEHFLP